MMNQACCAGITDAPLYKKTDKSKPMGANVALSNAIGGQPTERGASPILYAAACEDLTGALHYCLSLRPVPCWPLRILCKAEPRLGLMCAPTDACRPPCVISSR